MPFLPSRDSNEDNAHWDGASEAEEHAELVSCRPPVDLGRFFRAQSRTIILGAIVQGSRLFTALRALHVHAKATKVAMEFEKGSRAVAGILLLSRTHGVYSRLICRRHVDEAASVAIGGPATALFSAPCVKLKIITDYARSLQHFILHVLVVFGLHVAVA